MTVELLPFNTKLVEPVKFDVSIYPVRALLTTEGVQYNAVVTNATETYKDLFSIDTDTYFPHLKGNLAWVYVNISYILWSASGTPSWIIQARNKNGTWTAMSGTETQLISGQTSETDALKERLEGYLLLGDDINKVPFSIRLQFKADATLKTVSMRLKNDTVIRLVGSRETR